MYEYKGHTFYETVQEVREHQPDFIDMFELSNRVLRERALQNGTVGTHKPEPNTPPSKESA
jgi:hypothetical protein